MLVLVGLIVAVGLAWGAWMWSRVGVTDIENLLRAETPVGSHHTQVVRVLDSLQVEHSGYRESEGSIRAVWRRTSVSLLHESAIQARFRFGEDGTLQHIEVVEIVTGT